MKKYRFQAMVCVLVVGFCMLGWSFLAEAIAEKKVPIENHDFIRLHVLANSDSPQDQQLKLMVRDAVIQYIAPLVQGMTDKDEVRVCILQHKAGLMQVANETLLKQGAYYPVDVEYGMFDFPIKSYGELVVPAGKYEAVRVLIGDAEGTNWWCVLFPPLCFVDESKVVRQSEDVAIQDEVQQVERSLEFHWKIAEVLKSL